MSLKLLKIAINRTLGIKKGMKVSSILKKIMESKEAGEFTKARAKRDRQSVEKMIDKNMIDRGVGDVMMKRRERELIGRKKRGYIEKKLKENETYQGPNKDKYFKKGKFVQVKTKLGRNRPTKLY